jgi:glycosyltransferase involved in cell wall biosynthesis
MIAPGLQQVEIPKSPAHRRLELEVFRESGFATCAILPQAAGLTPEYGHRVKKLARDADIVILSHPYLYDAVQEAGNGRVVVYDAHNVEIDLHRQILPDSLSYLLADIGRVEAAACQRSRLIATCCAEDAGRLACLYNVAADKFVTVPNGADVGAIPFVSSGRRRLLKSAENATEPRAVYMGSNFPPNIEGAEQVLALAEELPAVRFVLLGGLCTAFAVRRLPDNVALLGAVTEQEKRRVFGLADVALNPVRAGSGTSLKMLEYMAAGLPVVTTRLGARGLDGKDGQHFLVGEGADMAAGIGALLSNPAMAASLAEQAYLLVKARFDWRQIAAGFADRLAAACDRRF